MKLGVTLGAVFYQHLALNILISFNSSFKDSIQFSYSHGPHCPVPSSLVKYSFLLFIHFFHSSNSEIFIEFLLEQVFAQEAVGQYKGK